MREAFLSSEEICSIELRKKTKSFCFRPREHVNDIRSISDSILLRFVRQERPQKSVIIPEADFLFHPITFVVDSLWDLIKLNRTNQGRDVFFFRCGN